MKILTFLIAAYAVLFTASPLWGQAQPQSPKPHNRVSPHETISTIVDGTFLNGNRVTIVYGRPFVKDPKTGEERKIWGDLVPYGKVWRTGADEATLLITQKPLLFGDLAVPAGAYTLWTLPQQDGSAQLIINKQVGQWGVGPDSYDEKFDLGRVDLKKETLATPVDQFTISVIKEPSGGGTIELMWQNTGYSAPITVPKE